MKKMLGAIAITAAAFATTAATAENATDEHRAKLLALWDKDTHDTRQAETEGTSFIGVSSLLRPETADAWAGNFQGGRTDPPTGR